KMISFDEKSTVCKYVVPCGYGYVPVENREIFVDEKRIEEEGGKIFYASVNEENGKIYTTKSRSLAILGIANEIYEAEEVCEKCLKYVKGDIFIRHDIGKKETIEKKIMSIKMWRG
ncbi:MAG: phosphoribosylglycinamide synthetase C domain-containing protein, partial [Candidatus Thermoplasmatota archaeon]